MHFEIPAANPARARRFYSGLFGWEFRRVPADSSEYWLIETGGGNGVNGGMTRAEKKGPGKMARRAGRYIHVPSLDDSIAKVRALGGRVVEPARMVPGGGRCAVCADTEGNVFGLWESDATVS